MSKFLPTSGFKWIDPKLFDLNEYTSNSSNRCVLVVDLEYPKELRELHNDYLLDADKTEIKKEMVYNYQLKIADLYNILLGNIKKLVPNFLIKKNFASLGKLATFLETRIQTKKSTSRIRIKSVTMIKTLC